LFKKISGLKSKILFPLLPLDFQKRINPLDRLPRITFGATKVMRAYRAVKFK
jgi:hypothetical protein